ncbi:MAG: thioredoxin family protein [Ignisphaera sp.]|uniref:Glutaredoxin n=1 Tax=Ignisphaera aggregans TaxID=334771 RepID=A0A7J3I8Z7_9CREN
MEYNVPPYIEEMFKVDLTESDIEALREALKEMRNTITIKLFTSDNKINCFTCSETEKLMKIVTDSSPLIGDRKAVELEIYEVSRDGDVFREYAVERVPTIMLFDDAITYIGMPAGEEIKGFIETIIRLSTNDHGLSTTTIKELAELSGQARIEVIVTPLCPYCPYAVLLSNMLAYASKVYGNGNVKSIIIEAYENPDIADKYAVSTVPTIAINGKVVFVGLPYEAQLLNAIKKLASRQIQL